MIWLLTQALALALSAPETIAVAGPAVKIADGTQISLAHSILTELKPGIEKAVSGVRRNGRKVGIRRLSARPYAYLLRGWLTNSECEYIMRLADAAREEELATTAGSEAVSAAWRKGCEVSHLSATADDVLLNITRDASRLIFSKDAWSRRKELASEIEFLQVLRYSEGGEFKVHWDACWKQPRAATLLYYLNGEGETWFPLACDSLEAARDSMPQRQSEAYERAFALDPTSDGLRVSPQQGDAILLYNFDEDAAIDVYSMHAGLPAAATKIIGTQFFSTKAATPPQESGWWDKETIKVPETYLLPLTEHVESNGARKVQSGGKGIQ